MDRSSSDRQIAAATRSPCGSRMVDSMSTGWTDEKHSRYLNSIEATFVNQLYSSEHHSNDSLRTRKHTNSSGSSATSLFSSQFKVHRRGCWEKLKVERLKRCVDVEDKSRFLSANPWIQHFRSPPIEKDRHTPESKKEAVLKTLSSNQLEDDEYHQDVYHQDSINSTAEVSDQNFVDEKFESTEKPSTTSCSRRSWKTVSPPIKDQVVPSRNLLGDSNSNENNAFLKSELVECSSRKSSGVAGVPYLESLPS